MPSNQVINILWTHLVMAYVAREPGRHLFISASATRMQWFHNHKIWTISVQSAVDFMSMRLRIASNYKILKRRPVLMRLSCVNFATSHFSMRIRCGDTNKSTQAIGRTFANFAARVSVRRGTWSCTSAFTLVNDRLFVNFARNLSQTPPTSENTKEVISEIRKRGLRLIIICRKALDWCCQKDMEKSTFYTSKVYSSPSFDSCGIAIFLGLEIGIRE